MGDQSSANLNKDEVKEAVKLVVEELQRWKLDEVVNHLKDKIQNTIEEVSVQMKAKLKAELRNFATELANQSQQQLQHLQSELEVQHKFQGLTLYPSRM